MLEFHQTSNLSSKAKEKELYYDDASESLPTQDAL